MIACPGSRFKRRTGKLVDMRNHFQSVCLAVIALFLGVLALRPLATPAPVQAQAAASELYIEPGVHPLRAPDGSREHMGKVVVDLRTGNVWGFPTATNKVPYPIVFADTQPPTSKPFLLGRFDLGAMK